MIEKFAHGSLELEQQGAIGIIRINRPDKHNAINREVWAAIPLLTAKLTDNSEIRAFVLTSAGRHFSAGADISEFDTTFANRDNALDYQATMGAAIEAIAAMPVPVIGAVEGLCIGGGVALATACDFVFASTTSQFAVTPGKLGMLYPAALTRRLVRVIGAAEAKRLLVTARRMDAEEAQRAGMVAALYPGGSVLEHAMKEAETISALSPTTVRGMKAFIDNMDDSQADADHGDAFIAALSGPDHAEGVAAFREKRSPDFG